MERFLIVYRGAPDAAPAPLERDQPRWAEWFASLGARLVERGSLAHGSVEIHSRLAGPKSSPSTLAAYSVLEAADFNEAVRLAESSPIFDEHGWVEVARLTHPPA